MADPCECGNKPSGSVKYKEFLTSWGTNGFSKGTLLYGFSYVVRLLKLAI